MKKIVNVAHTMYQINNLPYHNPTHIHRMVSDAQQILSYYGQSMTDELYLAIWFHDIVYRPGYIDNEQNSARLFKSVAEATDISINVNYVCKLINLTASHTEYLTNVLSTTSGHEQIIMDSDIIGLADNYADYHKSSQAIRQEFAHQSDAEFQKGRKWFLTTMLSKPRLYYTDYAYNNYEERARSNMELELLNFG